MTGGTKDLLASERGTLCMLLVVAATVLAIVGIINADQWLAYTKWICVALVASKTVTGTIETLKGSKPEAAADPAPIPIATVVKD